MLDLTARAFTWLFSLLKFDYCMVIRSGLDFRDNKFVDHHTMMVQVPSFVEFFASLFVRKDFDHIQEPNLRVNHSTHFSVGMFTYFILQTVFGFTFVNMVSLNNLRKNCFFTKRERRIYSPYEIYSADVKD